MSYRLTVTMTDHMRDELRTYANEHGATLGAGLLALAARGLRDVRREQDAAMTDTKGETR